MKKACLFVAAVLGLWSCTPTDPKYAITYAERRGVLESNGLHFVILPDPSTQLVEVDVRYEVGAREDPEGKAGLAHVVEHTMFQLRPDGDNSPPLMQFISQLSTGFNAYTSWDSTHYMTSSRADQLEELLKIEAMRLFYGCKTVPEEQFNREREVVRNEIRWRGGDAQGQIPPMILGDVFPKGHAYERMVGGDDRQIAGVSLADACKFIADYYVPERATIVIAGGVDYDKTVELIKKWFGKLEKRAGAPRKEVEQIEPKPGKHEYQLDIERPVVAVSWALPPTNTEEGRNANYGIGQTFFKTLVQAQKWDFAYSVQPSILGGAEAPVFSILMTLKGMDKLDEALAFVWKAAKSAHRGFADVTWQQFDISRKQSKADFIANLEPLAARTNQIGDLVQFDKDVDFSSGDAYMIREIERYDHFDGDAIAHAIKKYIDPERAVVDIFKPNKEGIKGDVRAKVQFQTKSDATMELAEVDPKEAFRPLKVSTELKALDGAIRYELGNGMKVVLLPVAGSLPVFSAQLTFNAGDVHSPTPGLAWAAASFRNSDAEETALATTGVRINGATTPDQTIFFSRSINIYLGTVIKGLERFISVGEYDQDQLDAWKKGVREDYQTVEQQAASEYSRQLYGALYGAEHLYARNAVILPDDIKGIGVDELNKFARTHYSAGNATLIVAGNFDAEVAKKDIASAFGSWKKDHVDEPIGGELRTRTGAEFIGVAGRGGGEMDLTIAFPSTAGIDGEEGARQVLGEILNLRMGNVVRAQLGSSYSLFPAHREVNFGPSAYVISATIDPARGGESLLALQAALEDLRNGGDQFDIDFVRARRMLIQNLLAESTVSFQLAGKLAKIDGFKLPIDYYGTLLKTIAAVSPAQVKSLITRELSADKEIVVALGDRATVESTFKDAGINDVKIVDQDYK
jgi:zinc protease